MVRAMIVAAALLALALSRLITAAPLDLLGARAEGTPNPVEQAGATFPGSAFFFAEGAFDAVAKVTAADSPHVLGLEEAQAAPAAIFRGSTPLDSYRALNCLTAAVYYEAGNEPEDGQRAVAQVVLNRVRSRSWPNSVCGVVYEGSDRTDRKCQFSFGCDGAMTRVPLATRWSQARRVARQALAGRGYAPVGLATYYHTLAVRPPWSARMKPVAVIGAHIFYRSPGAEGTAATFGAAYTGQELISGPARTPAPGRAEARIDFMPLRQETVPVAPKPLKETMSKTDVMQNVPAEGSLPESTIRPEYRNTGRPIS